MTALPVRQLRASIRQHFPYLDGNVTYLVASNGVVLPLDVNSDTVRDIVNSENKIFAVWPGKQKSDLFVIDKFELAKAFLNE